VTCTKKKRAGAAHLWGVFPHFLRDFIQVKTVRTIIHGEENDLKKKGEEMEEGSPPASSLRGTCAEAKGRQGGPNWVQGVQSGAAS